MAAFPLYDALERMGFSVWIDREEIVTGDQIFENIETAIRNSACVIALIAPPYINRAWTQRELQLALELEQSRGSNSGRRLFPIYHQVSHVQVIKVFPALQGRAYEELDSDKFDPFHEKGRAVLDRAVLWFFSNVCCQDGPKDFAWLESYQHFPHIPQLLLLCKSCICSVGDLRTELLEHSNMLRYLLAILSEYDQPFEAKHRQTIAKNYCDDLAARCFSFHDYIAYDMLLACRAMCTPLYGDLKTVLNTVEDS